MLVNHKEQLPAITSFSFFFFFVFVSSMKKFLGQESNMRHSSDPSHSSDNTKSLTHWATRELPVLHPFNYNYMGGGLGMKVWTDGL